MKKIRVRIGHWIEKNVILGDTYLYHIMSQNSSLIDKLSAKDTENDGRMNRMQQRILELEKKLDRNGIK